MLALLDLTHGMFQCCFVRETQRSTGVHVDRPPPVCDADCGALCPSSWTFVGNTDKFRIRGMAFALLKASGRLVWRFPDPGGPPGIGQNH